MTAISFSAMEILKPLLKKEKDQTIRPGKPRMKVGDKAIFYWKQRGLNKEFCSKCGAGDPVTMFPNDGCYVCSAGFEHRFSKILGYGRITEVFQIFMSGEGVASYPIGNAFDLENIFPAVDLNILSSKDGFKSVRDMMEYFNQNYNILNEGKVFTVYRWRWL